MCYSPTSIPMPSQDVIAQCEVMVGIILAKQSEIDENYRRNVIARLAWWAKWFWWLGYKPLRPEDADAYIKSCYEDMRLRPYPTNMYGNQLDIARTLIRMAGKADVVTICRDDYDSIFKGC